MLSEAQSPPKVFISYSHDSLEHKSSVRGLSDRLRQEGIDSNIDQYEQSPPEGWARWMERQIEEADFVLVVCTETYARRFRGVEVPGRGLGGSWEGAILTQHLYEAQTKNTRFVPVLFTPEDEAHIPVALRGTTHYRVNTQEGYVRLYRYLTAQPEIRRPRLGQRRVLPPLDSKHSSSTEQGLVENIEKSSSGQPPPEPPAAATNPRRGTLPSFGIDVANEAAEEATPPITKASSNTPAPSVKGSIEFAVGVTRTSASGDKITLHSYESPVPSAAARDQPEVGYEFSAFDIEGCAGQDPEGPLTWINPFLFRLVMPDNTRLQPEDPNVRAKKRSLEHTDLLPGDCVRGWVVFQTPKGEKPKAMIFSAMGVSGEKWIPRWPL